MANKDSKESKKSKESKERNGSKDSVKSKEHTYEWLIVQTSICHSLLIRVLVVYQDWIIDYLFHQSFLLSSLNSPKNGSGGSGVLCISDQFMIVSILQIMSSNLNHLVSHGLLEESQKAPFYKVIRIFKSKLYDMNNTDHINSKSPLIEQYQALKALKSLKEEKLRNLKTSKMSKDGKKLDSKPKSKSEETNKQKNENKEKKKNEKKDFGEFNHLKIEDIEAAIEMGKSRDKQRVEELTPLVLDDNDWNALAEIDFSALGGLGALGDLGDTDSTVDANTNVNANVSVDSVANGNTTESTVAPIGPVVPSMHGKQDNSYDTRTQIDSRRGNASENVNGSESGGWQNVTNLNLSYF